MIFFRWNKLINFIFEFCIIHCCLDNSLIILNDVFKLDKALGELFIHIQCYVHLSATFFMNFIHYFELNKLLLLKNFKRHYSSCLPALLIYMSYCILYGQNQMILSRVSWKVKSVFKWIYLCSLWFTFKKHYATEILASFTPNILLLKNDHENY